MTKKVVIRYSSHLNITFHGEEEIWEMDDEEYDDYSPDELEDMLREEEQTWLNEHIEVWARVIDGELDGD